MTSDAMVSKEGPNRDLLWRVVAGEALLLDTISGNYFSMNPVATRIWEKLAAGETPERVAASIAETYSISLETAREDIEELLTEMRDANIWR